jgi:hypothetical protein
MPEMKTRNALPEGGGKVLAASLVFMGLGHIIYLKQYLKGILLALIEVVMIILSPDCGSVD